MRLLGSQCRICDQPCHGHLAIACYDQEVATVLDRTLASKEAKALALDRLKNLADALFAPMSRLELVESLIPHRLELASQLAALEFERAVRSYAKKSASTDDLSNIIQAYAPHHAVGQWQRCRTLRNRAVHGKALDEREVSDLVLAVRQITDLEKLKRG